MKKILLVNFIMGLMFNCIYAQQTVNTNPVYGNNIVKFNLTGVAISHYAIQYERVIGKKQSLAIGFGFTPEVGLPFKSSLMEQFSGNADAKRAIESTKFSKYSITPEYRFYLGKRGAPAGFYVAPFARFTHMSTTQTYSFTPSSGRLHTPTMKGTFNGYGGGILIGNQWVLGKQKNIVIDLWIAGPFIGAIDSKFHAVDDMSDMSAADKADLKSDIESTELPFWTIDATVGNNVVDAKLKGPFYGFRTLGLCIGYRF